MTRVGGTHESESGDIDLGAIVRSADDAIIGKTLDGIITSWNDAAERLYGWTSKEVVGRSIEVIVPDDRRSEIPRILERLRQGQQISSFETRRRHKDGTILEVSVTISPIMDVDGKVIGASAIARDVTPIRRAAERTARLLEVTAALSDALTEERVVQSAVDLGVRAMDAAGAVLVLVDPDGRSARLASSIGYPGEVVDRWTTWSIDEPIPINDALRTGRLVTVEDAQAHDDRYEGMGPLLQPDTRAMAAVPLATEGPPLGALGLRFTTARRFTSEDRDYMRSLGGQCAIALERARLFESEKATRERLVFLAQAGEALAGSLDVDTILSTIARLAVPRLADWCGVTVVNDDRSVRRFGIHHVDPSKLELARRWWEEGPFDTTRRMGAPNVIRTGEAELTPSIDQDRVLRYSVEEDRAAISELGIGASMIVPLVARGRILGAVTFVMGESGRGYTEADLGLAQDLARRAALAADNARLFAERSHVARKLQESLLPQLLPDIPGIELAARYLAAGEGTEVGGDFYDVFSIGGDTWAVAVGDVCGKGADAAGVTALARYTLRALASHSETACGVLEELNDAVLRQNVSDERFLTIVHGRLSRTSEGYRLAVCLAGHPPPIVVRRGGEVTEPVGVAGSIIGVFPQTELVDAAVDLRPGDMVVLYTDGVTEAHGDDGLFGEDRLRATLAANSGASAAHVAAEVARAVATYRNGGGEDDMAVLVIRVT